MALLHLDIDEATSVMTVDAWIRMMWKDEHLSWNKTEYGGVNQLHFSDDELWRPDIMLYNKYEYCKDFEISNIVNMIILKTITSFIHSPHLILVLMGPTSNISGKHSFLYFQREVGIKIQ